MNKEAKSGVAFGNIKTHKVGNPLRLITSCCGTAIENLSAFTEFYLQPLARELPSFIKDTTDLLNRIEDLNQSGPFPEGTLLVDVAPPPWVLDQHSSFQAKIYRGSFLKIRSDITA